MYAYEMRDFHKKKTPIWNVKYVLNIICIKKTAICLLENGKF